MPALTNVLLPGVYIMEGLKKAIQMRLIGKVAALAANAFNWARPSAFAMFK
jgi:hypothetical protein